MLFPTVEFAIFFCVVVLLSWAVKAYSTQWKVLMIIASYFFYGWWDSRFVGLIAASTLFNFYIGTKVGVRRSTVRGRWLAGGIAGNLIVLGFFKYYNFFASSVDNGLHNLHVEAPVPVLSIILPIGISFFTFQAISYLVDLYRNTLRPAKLLDFAVFLSFFPHVVAGPIVRGSEFLPQFKRKKAPRLDSSRALFLICGGLFKKIVIASFLGTQIVDPIFANPQGFSGIDIAGAIYAYAVQIWADFSGYTDIAIGCALILGIKFPDNFNAPYSARSLQDFWHRWHMSLSRWLRDYLYIPLGGNRKGSLLTYRNLIITMVLGGLWHGAAWTFVIWGALHGAGLAIERVFRSRRIGQAAVWDRRGILRWLLTFHVVCLAWVFFRADSLSTAWQILTRLFSAHGPAHLFTASVLLVVVASIASQFISKESILKLQRNFGRLTPVLQGAALGAAVLMIEALSPPGIAPFIYYRF